MSGDLFTLRMIVVSDVPQHRELWRNAAALASVPIEVVETGGADSCPLLSQGDLDIVLLDDNVAERDAAIRIARALSPRPLVALTSAAISTVEGADLVVSKAETTDQARKHVERCITMRRPKHVLIVDDSTTMRSIVRKILAACRYSLEVSEADEGIAALRNIGRGIDLVLLDYNMPGFNGFETLAEIKRIAPQVNVVMMTSSENDALAMRAEASGAIGFLKKPFYATDVDGVLDMLYDADARR